MFARAPEAGRVKTRLGLDGGAAAALHVAFVDDVCRLTRGLAARRTLAVAGDAGHPDLVALAAREGMALVEQQGGDLGERLHGAVVAGLAAGAGRVAIVGSDAPLLPPRLVAEALAALMAVDVVLGPCEDGGYWLVGARRPVPWLFRDIAWSTAAVLAQSQQRLLEHGASHRLADRFWDVDTAADLARLARALAADPGPAPATRAALQALGLLPPHRGATG